MMNSISCLKERHLFKKQNIEKRLNQFGDIWIRKDEKELFLEFCFCLLTPQSAGRKADNAMKSLIEDNVLFQGNTEEIIPRLNKNAIRFSKTKAQRLIKYRDEFLNSCNSKISEIIDENNVFQTRESLVKNINGFGYKEASHFLRNIGLGENMAILDRHILKNMKKFGIIREIPKTLTRKNYLELEEKLRKFSKLHKIPLSHLDLLFWSEETGEIFK